MLVLAPLTLRHDLPNAYDTDAFYAPFAAFLHERLSHGDIPLWNPFAFSGQPFAADPQSGALYPPALLAYGLLAPASGMVAIVTFDYLLATLSSYAFARLVGAGRLGAVYAGVAFGAGGFLLARSQALGLLAGAAWLAAAVAAAQYAASREGRGASALPLAAALALAILGGSQQLTAVAATSALVLLVVQLRRRGLAIFVGAGSAAVGLAAVALLPRLELVSLSSAADGVRDPPGVGKLNWSDTRLVFGSFGTHAGELAPLYAGALMPALAVLAIVRRWRHARVPLALAILAILWSAGLAGVLADPIEPLRSITAHQAVRALPLLALALAALAGLAFGSPGSRPSPWLVAALAAVLALLFKPDVLTHPFYVGPALALVAALALLRSRRMPLAVLACALVPAVLAIDLARHDYRQRNPHQPAANWDDAGEAFPGPPATARFLLERRAAEGPTRFATLANDFTLRKQLRFGRSPKHLDLLLNMAGMRYGLEDVAGYDPLQLLTYRDAMTASNETPSPTATSSGSRWGSGGSCGCSACRYYVAQAGEVLRRLPVVMRTPTATVVRDDKALPIARINRPGRTVAARSGVASPRPRGRRVAGRARRAARAGRFAVPRLAGLRRREAHADEGAERALPRGRPAGRSSSRRVAFRAPQRAPRPGDLARDAARGDGLRARHVAARAPPKALAQRVDERREALGVERRRGARADRDGHDAAARGERGELVAHALDAPAAGRREARIRRQRRVEHVGVDVHVERGGGGEQRQRSRGVPGLAQLRAVDVVALPGVEVAAADEHGALLLQRRLEARAAAPVVAPPAEQLGERHAADEPAGRRVGRVEVAVGVDPHELDVRVALAHRGEHGRHERALAHQHDRRPGGDGRAAERVQLGQVPGQRLLGRQIAEGDLGALAEPERISERMQLGGRLGGRHPAARRTGRRSAGACRPG